MLKAIIEKLKNHWKLLAIIGGGIVAALLIAFGAYQLWRLFTPTVIKGMDVSHYQGDVSWRAITENSDVKFVYIKATEGSTYTDPNFAQNWKGASSNGIAVGAYHYYLQTSTGTDQANNFIDVVPKKKGALPPAIDIETNVTSQSDFKSQLADYVSLVRKHYGQKPVFYVPTKVYNLIYDDYTGYDFWIINVNSKPDVKGWTFWQYSDKGKLAGISGTVDLDQYRGSRWNFRHLLLR